MENNTSAVTQDEKLLALLSHLSLLFGGIILPIIVWAVQKDKSQFVRFHSLQAIFFHIAYLAAVIIFAVLIVIAALVFGLGAGLFATRHASDPGAFLFLIIGITALLYIGIFLLIFAFIGYAVYIGIKAYGGEFKMIPFIGRRVYESISRGK